VRDRGNPSEFPGPDCAGPPLEESIMSICIEGVLVRDAEKYSTGPRGASVRLMVSIGRGLPYEYLHLVGETPDDHINAAALASRMKRGEPVAIVALFCEQCIDHGEARFVVRQATRVSVGAKVLL
jgi:hypothetical protein